MLSRIVSKCGSISANNYGLKFSTKLFPALWSGFFQTQRHNTSKAHPWSHNEPYHMDKLEQKKHNKDKHRPYEPDTVLEFNISPIGYEFDSMATFVGICAQEVKRSGLVHQIHPMGAVVEGNLDEVLEVVKQAVDKSLRKAPRVVVNVKADIRPGYENRLARKTARINTVLDTLGTTENEVIKPEFKLDKENVIT